MKNSNRGRPKSTARGKSAAKGKSASKSQAKDTKKKKSTSRKPAIVKQEQSPQTGGKRKSAPSGKKRQVMGPERPMTAYVFFANEVVPKIKKEEKLSHMLALKKAQGMWSSISKEDQEKYLKMEKEEMKRYEMQMKQFDATGSYKGADGQRVSGAKGRKSTATERSSVSPSKPSKKSQDYKYHLYYFNQFGRAEKLRMLLSHSKQPFLDVKFFRDEFEEKMKPSGYFEFGQAPVLEYQNKSYAQSHAILYLLGRLHGYYPKDAFQAWEVDSIVEWNRDFLDTWWWWIYMAPNEMAQERLAEYKNKHLPNYLEKLDNRLEENAKKYNGSLYISTSKMTIADFDLASIAYCYLLNEDNLFYKEQKAVLGRFPRVAGYFEFLAEELHDYLQSRPRMPY